MASRADRSRIASALAALVVLSATPAAHADVGRDANAETDGDSVEVVFTRQEDGRARGRPRRGTSSCEWSAIRQEESSYFEPQVPPAPSPEHTLWVVFCDVEYRGMRWLGPREFTDGAVLGQVEQRIHELVVLPAAMEVRPNNRGITGIASWFWVQGYDGQPVSATFSEFGLTVTVTAQLAGVEWDFGDGTPPVQAGLGEAYPQESSVRHAYRYVSGPTPYTVMARLIFQPTYTVNGTPGAPLEPIVVPITRPYRVNQVQAIRRR
jgi:hypothetical protein